jgi:hypothetical protein
MFEISKTTDINYLVQGGQLYSEPSPLARLPWSLPWQPWAIGLFPIVIVAVCTGKRTATVIV